MSIMALSVLCCLALSAGAEGFVAIDALGSFGDQDGQFDTPFDVVVLDGELYVADSHHNRVQVFGLDLVYRRKFGSTGDLPGQFRRNRGIGASRSGESRIYITDAKNDRVHELWTDGEPIAVWGSLGPGEEQFFRPRGVDTARDGSIVVTDADNHRLKIHRSDRSLRAIVGGQGSGDGQFARPFDCAVSESGEIYVVDAYNARIQVFDLRGAFLFRFGSYGIGDGEFIVPQAIAIAPDGRVFVAEHGDEQFDVERIQIFSASGEWEASFASEGGELGEIRWVTGLAFDEDGKLYAAEASNHRVSIWVDPSKIPVARSSFSQLKSRFGKGTGGG